MRSTYPTFDLSLDSAEIRDWIDIVVSPSDINVEHPLDLFHFYKKFEIIPTKLTLSIPDGSHFYSSDGILIYLQTSNSTYGTALLTIDVKKDSCCQFLFIGNPELGKRSYIWNNQVQLSPKDNGYLLSLPDFESDSRVTVSIHRQGLNVSSLSTLNTYWVDIHKYEAIFFPFEPFVCTERAFICINYSSVLNNMESKIITEHYYVYIMPQTLWALFSENRKLKKKLTISWNEAFELCRSVNGTLPILRSKQQQDEILSFLSSQHSPPPIFTLFIGLTTSPHNEKVTKLFLHDG